MKVNREDPYVKRRSMKTRIEKICLRLLGKSGIELPIENYGSFFSSFAVGIYVCDQR